MCTSIPSHLAFKIFSALRINRSTRSRTLKETQTRKCQPTFIRRLRPSR